MSSKETDKALVDVNKRDKEAAVNKYKEFKKKNRTCWITGNSIASLFSAVMATYCFMVLFYVTGDCGGPEFKPVIWMVAIMHCLNAFEFLLNLTGLEQHLCNNYTGCFFFGYEVVVLVFMQVVYFDTTAINCADTYPWLYYTLMFNIFIFYFMVVFSCCFVFRKFCGDPKYDAVNQEEE